MKPLCFLLVLVLPLAAQRKPGSQIDHLPPNIEVLTHFGERADISPDNRQVAFMAKSFGDAMVIDLDQRSVRCLTCNVPAAAFLRVMHLSTGDYILIGPDHFEDIRTSRLRDNQLWVLKRAPGSKPVKLGQKMKRGRCRFQEEPQNLVLSDPRAGARPGARCVAADGGRRGRARLPSW